MLLPRSAARIVRRKWEEEEEEEVVAAGRPEEGGGGDGLATRALSASGLCNLQCLNSIVDGGGRKLEAGCRALGSGSWFHSFIGAAMELGQLSGNGRAKLLIWIYGREKVTGGGFCQSGQKGGLTVGETDNPFKLGVVPGMLFLTPIFLLAPSSMGKVSRTEENSSWEQFIARGGHPLPAC